MRSISHLPGAWSMTSFDYGKSPKTGIVPFSTYQTRSYKRASSRSIPRTSHRWWHFNGFEDGLNKNVDYLLSLFILFRPDPASCDNFNDEKQRPCSKTQQLLCLHSLVNDVMGRLFLTGRSATVTPVGSHFGSGVTKLVL